VARHQHTIEKVTVDINTLDVPGRGEAGMYLTVLGTSAEGGDCGQVGRGNKVNGVIALNRPMSTEAAAGKNPVSHVGKIYNLLSHKIAEKVYETVPGIREVYIWLCSQIGQPIDQPLIASAQLILEPGMELEAIRGDIEAVIENELASIYDFTDRLARGEFMVW
jgi:S-adenosylmethionine synthetase